MRAIEFLTESSIPEISQQEALDRKMFGPLYHGSPHIEDIIKKGFDISKSIPKGIGAKGYRIAPIGTSNGYSFESYGYTGYPPPIHHLGFAIYFTTKKAIAKQYNNNSTRGLYQFYLDIREDEIEVINFASPEKMMNWWFENGYNPPQDILEKRDFNAWVKATKNLTKTLRSQYKAVWFQGRSLFGRLLDGDQVAVYDPQFIYVVNPNLAKGLEVGARVVHNQNTNRWQESDDVYVDYITAENSGEHISPKRIGWRAYFRRFPDGQTAPIHYIPPPSIKGTIVDKRRIESRYKPYHQGSEYMIAVKWDKGGTIHNYYESDLTPLK